VTYHDVDIAPVELPFGIGEIDYTEYSDRQLAAIPLGVLAVALVVLAVWTFMVAPTGVPVVLGIEFTGGTELAIETTDSQAQIQETFGGDATVRAVQGQGETYIVIVQSDDASAVRDQADAAGYTVQYGVTTGERFGAQSQRLALFGVGVAFVGMSLVVFLIFRSFVPSIAVVVSAFSDIVIPLAVMDLVGIPLELGTIAALLMLIGYSVDSDILLNNHVLRRRGGFYESAYRAMRTGVTMTLTSIVAMVVMTLVASYFQIPLMPAIGQVLVVGLTADLMNTYLLNFSLLRWYKYEGVNR
jgi:preprotein translocase subunit SecF